MGFAKSTVGVLVVIFLVVVLSFALLVWGGALQVFQTQINRTVVVNSQQYITSINTSLVNYKADYEATTDANRRASIVLQFCTAASKIQPDQISSQLQPFYQVHCN